METRPDYRAPSLPFISSFPFPSFPFPPPLFSPFLSFLLAHAFGVSKHVATRWKKSPVRKNDRNTFRVGWGQGHVDAPRIKGRFSASSLSFLSYSSLFFSRRFVFFFTSFFSFIPPTSAFCKHGDTATGIPKRPEKYSLGAVQVDSIDVTKPPTIRWFFHGNPVAPNEGGKSRGFYNERSITRYVQRYEETPSALFQRKLWTEEAKMRENVPHTHLCVGVRFFRYFVVVMVQVDVIYESECKFTIYLLIYLYIYLLTALQII